MFNIEADTRKLEQTLRLFAKESKRDFDNVVEQQSRLMVGSLIAMTPPGTPKDNIDGITSAAKKRGEAKIRAEISALFPTSGMKEARARGMIEDGFYWQTGKGKKKLTQYAANISDLRRIHKNSRSQYTGRVKVGQSGQYMALTRKALRTQFIKEQIKTVGKLNAGWIKAARELGTAKGKTPAWITRHGAGPGDVSRRETKGGLTITMANRMSYFPKDQMRRYGYAIRRRTRSMQNQLEHFMDKNISKATRKLMRKI